MLIKTADEQVLCGCETFYRALSYMNYEDGGFREMPKNFNEEKIRANCTWFVYM